MANTAADPNAWHDYPMNSDLSQSNNNKEEKENEKEKDVEYSELEEDEIVFDIAAKRY